MKTVADLINDWLQTSGENITVLAKRAEVNRILLSRLRNGQRPPRARNAWRWPPHDPRYSRLAHELGLNTDEFCALVAKEQNGSDEQVVVGLMHVEAALDRLGRYALDGEGKPEERRYVRERLKRIVRALEPA